MSDDVAGAYDARADEYVALAGDLALMSAWFWSSEALAELLDTAGFRLTASETREREAGEISRRPHASLTAVRR